jgi:hypothetical protein
MGSLTKTFRWFSSLRLTIILLCIVTATLAVAMLARGLYGESVASWYILEAQWFQGLLVLLGLNCLLALLAQLPWQMRKLGIYFSLIGVLLLISGWGLNLTQGVQGQMSLSQGQTSNNLVIAGEEQVSISWQQQPAKLPITLPFRPGPVDLSESRSGKIGAVDGVQVEVVRFLRNASVKQEWQPSTSTQDGPYLEFEVLGSDGKSVARHWLVDQRYGDAVLVGPLRLQLQQAQGEQMVAEFRQLQHAPQLGEKGRLSMYYQGETRHVSVDEFQGQAISFEDGTTVEIVDYLPNAVPDKLGRFRTKDELTRNPLLELRVRTIDGPEPLRQIAFAKDPLLNLDGVYERDCPVKFRYEHPAIELPTRVEFLQSSAGKLFARISVGNSDLSCEEVEVPCKLELPGGFQLALHKHLAHAKLQLQYEAAHAPLPASGARSSITAALIELSANGQKEQCWLHRSEGQLESQAVSTTLGKLRLKLEPRSVPWKYALRVGEIRRTSTNNEHGAHVKLLLTSPASSTTEQFASQDQPLVFAGYNVYPSHIEDTGHGLEIVTLQITKRPGGPLQAAGGLLMASGVIALALLGWISKTRAPRAIPRRRNIRPRTPTSAIAG